MSDELPNFEHEPRTLHEILASRTFQDVDEDLEPDDIVLDVVVLMRVMQPGGMGRGESALVIIPEEGQDPIIQSGMLNNAVASYNFGYFSDGD